MNSPTIWILFPILAMIPLWLFRKNRNFTFLAAIAICAFLAILATALPFERLVTFSFFNLNLAATFSILGRKLVLADSMRPLLVVSYTACAIWLLYGWLGKVRRVFASFALGLVALMIAATAVEPFLYSALIIEIAVLASCVLLAVPGERNSPGIMRYLIFQTLAVPFILFSGWITGVAGINPTDPAMINVIILLVGLGFAFWLAVFPFYTWVPILSGGSEPISQGFILGMLPSYIMFLLLRFMDGYIWLRESSTIFTVMKFAGMLMVTTGGIWALFQKKLSRLLGYAIIMETGFVLIAIGLKTETGLQFFAMSIFPRMLAIAAWSFILDQLRTQKIEDTPQGMNGLFQRSPWMAISLTLILFAFSGVPLFAFFPQRLILLQALANENVNLLVWIFAGTLGFFIGAIRFVVPIFQKSTSMEKLPQPRGLTIVVGVVIILLLLMGTFPSMMFSGMDRILNTFQYLKW